MAEPLFLILHKVRGEPAFDIAHQLDIGDEIGWIIPTSGHRAYPFDKCNLSQLTADAPSTMMASMTYDYGNAWRNHPDHYEQSTPTFRQAASDLLASLGLGQKQIKRRKL